MRVHIREKVDRVVIGGAEPLTHTISIFIKCKVWHILLTIILIPVSLSWSRVNTAAKQFLFTLQPQLTDTLDNILTATASAGQLDNGLDNSL